MTTIEHVLEAVNKQGDKVQELAIQVALNSQATGELASQVVTMNAAVVGKNGVAQRLTAVETRLSERTAKIRHSKPPAPVNGRTSTVKVVGSIIAAMVALTGIVISVLAAANCG